MGLAVGLPLPRSATSGELTSGTANLSIPPFDPSREPCRVNHTHGDSRNAVVGLHR